MSEVSRPLSPHLQVYRWQVSNTLSILHRLTGIGLSLGAVVLVAWLLTLASGQSAFTDLGWLLASYPGQVFLVGWTFCFSYHLCNGIRHLAWDVGVGFDRAVARKTGLIAVMAAVLLTLAFWFVALTRVAA